QLLSLPIQPHQHTSGEIANGLLGVIRNQQWIETLRFCAQRKTQLRFRINGAGKQKEACNAAKRKEWAKAFHTAYSSLLRASSKQLTTRTSNASGTSFQGASLRENMPSSSRNRPPHDGIGSVMPSPRIPRLASARMNTGIEIQNCAIRIGFKFGNTCTTN